MALLVDQRGRTRILTIDRPEVRNALDATHAQALGAALGAASRDEQISVVVLASSGRDVFVAGGDLNELGLLPDDERGARHLLDMGAALAEIERCSVPVIAAVQGDAIGGGAELLTLCDLVVMEEQAGLRFVEVRMGVSPAWGGATRLVERAGASRATELLLTTRRVAAHEAVAMGLATQLAATGDALPAALRLAEQIASAERTAVVAAKRAVLEVRLARRGDAVAREATVFAESWQTAARHAALRPASRRPAS